MNKLKQWGRALVMENFTFLGLFVAWVVLEGSAKTVVGYAIIGTTVVWMLTYPLRNQKDKEDE